MVLSSGNNDVRNVFGCINNITCITAVKRDICIQISDWQTCRQVIRRLTAYDKTLYSVHWISCSCRCWPAAGPAPTAFDTVAVDTWSLLADRLDTMFSSSSQHFYTTEMYCWTTRLSICSRLLFKPQARCIQKSGVHHQYTHTHAHTCSTALCLGLPG